MDWRRTGTAIPGYDCLHSPCRHDPPGEHGISGGEWIFAVENGSAAAVLRVLTSFYPETVPEAVRSVCGWPARRDRILGSVSFHRAAEENDTTAQLCCYLPGGKCRCDCSYMLADEFLPVLAPTFEQPEELWLLLEAMAVKHASETGQH